MDFRSNWPDNSEAFVVANITGDISSPAGLPNADWQEMKGVSGELANTILLVDTVAGQQLIVEDVSISRSAAVARN